MGNKGALGMRRGFLVGMAILTLSFNALAKDRLSAEESRWKNQGADIDQRWVISDFLGDALLVDMASIKRNGRMVSFWIWEDADDLDRGLDPAALEKKIMATVDCSTMEISRDSQVVIGSDARILDSFDRPAGSRMRRTVPGSVGERLAIFGCN